MNTPPSICGMWAASRGLGEELGILAGAGREDPGGSEHLKNGNYPRAVAQKLAQNRLEAINPRC